jgi:ribosome-binding protein aMBF1 (putative translation factor)
MEHILKKCKCCGRELPIYCFKASRWGGRVSVCTECATNKLRENKQKRLDEQKQKAEDMRAETRQLCLADFTPRELMAELKRRGYEGKITYVETHTIDLSTL